MNNPSIFLVLFIFCSFGSSGSLSQSVYVEDWLGKWESTYTIEEGLRTGTVKEYLFIEEIHKKRFVHFSINGGFLDDSILEFKYTKDIFLTFNLALKNISGPLISGPLIDDNGYNGMMILSGTITSDNQITIEGDCPLWTIKTIWELKDDGKLYRKNSIKYKESGKSSITEAVFTKN